MSEFKDLKMVMAAEIVRKPESVKELTGKVRTLYDQSMTMKGIMFDNIERAMNIMAEDGWVPKTMAIEADSTFRRCYVIMEKKV